MERFQKIWAPIAAIVGAVLLILQLSQALAGNRNLTTALLTLISLIAIGAGMWEYAFAISVVPPFPKYRYHWIAKIIIVLDVISILFSGTYILTVLEVLPDCCGWIPPKLIPTLAPSETLMSDPCENFISRVQKGQNVYIANLLNENLNVRRSPNISAEKITSVKNGTEFQIIDGPVCADGLMWWEGVPNIEDK